MLRRIAALLLAVQLAAGAAAQESKVELFVEDSARSAGFYAQLGFAITEHKPDGYTTLRRGDFVLALSPLPSWLPLSWLGFLRSPPLGTELVFYVDDLPAQREALATAGAEPGEIRLQPWGDRDFRVDDPDGYYVRVSDGPRAGGSDGPDGSEGVAPAP